MQTLDEITNLRLIENGLLHLQFELQREAPSCFRVARESHLALYRAMVEVLRGSANLAVTAQVRKDWSIKYETGAGGWREIRRSTVTGCAKAWRFSEPDTCAPPMASVSSRRQPREREYLIGFYDALAMIQTECFMGRFVHSRWQRISDDDMHDFEWLHERVRNEYEHFVPKLYVAPSRDLLNAASLSLLTSDFLIFESGNVLFRQTLRSLLRSVLAKIQEHEKQG